jgi:allantoicase
VVDRVRLEIHPDGGVARFRVLGSPDKAAVADRMVTWLNALHVPEATARFASCCGAGSWASQMARRRPFPDAPTVLATASEVFTSLTAADWEEAFAAHPRIGERAGRQDERGEAWSEREQSGVTEAAARVRAALAEGNLAYEDRFDRTYIVRAAGRSAEELLSLLEERLANDPEEELRVAAGEQREITALRLERLLGIEEL